ncbi:alpha-amylase [Mycena polygramma]|nr:alpha-amylase [Mycena polygramma]
MLSLSKIALLSMLSADSALAVGSRIFRRSPSKANNAIVQLFGWPWDSVASECAFLGAAGYGYVQVSPPSEHIQGGQWWTDYQPVSYKLQSKRGTRLQFIQMVNTCKGAGVDVIADVVLNHMSAGSGTGFAGSSYSKYNYPSVPYTASNFHYCNGNTASNINNYNNAFNVQNCELVGLADLAQEQPAVQKIMAAYLNDLLSLGVAGFRIDAAKHMVDADLASIFRLLNAPCYKTQEVIYGAGEAVQPSQYTTTGDVIEFRAPKTAMSYFTGSSGGIATLVTPTPMGAAWGFVDSAVANYIHANQDTERNGGSLNYQSLNNAYMLSAIFMLGFNYGTPTIYSGYNFSNFDAGPSQTAAGVTNPVSCSLNGWRCEHRSPALVNMIGFHNAAGSSALTNIQKGSSQQIAFGRGNTGFLIINNDNTVWTNVWTTSLPAGTYYDIIHDTAVDPKICNGPSYVVSATGTLSVSVGPHDALALSIAFPGTASNTAATTPAPAPAPATTPAPAPATTPASTTASVTFSESASTVSGEVIKLVGSISQLGNWAPASAIALSNINSVWSVTLALPPKTAVQYKFIRVKTATQAVSWESDPNRSYTSLSAGSSTTLSSSFR